MVTIDTILLQLTPFLSKIDSANLYKLAMNKRVDQLIQTIREDNILIDAWHTIVDKLSPVFDDTYGFSQGYFSARQTIQNNGWVDAILRINIMCTSYCVFFEETEEINGWYVCPKRYILSDQLDDYYRFIDGLTRTTTLSDTLINSRYEFVKPYIRLSPKSDDERLFLDSSIKSVDKAFGYPLLLDSYLLNSYLSKLVAYDEEGDAYTPTVFECLFNLGFRNEVHE